MSFCMFFFSGSVILLSQIVVGVLNGRRNRSSAASPSHTAIFTSSNEDSGLKPPINGFHN